MIRVRGAGERCEPWSAGPDPSALAFAHLRTTGPDLARDGVIRVLASRRCSNPDRWEDLDLVCDPRPGGAGSEVEHEVTTRRLLECGVASADLVGAPTSAQALAELAHFLAGRPVIVADARELAARLSSVEGRSPPWLLDLRTLAALFSPGRASALVDPAPKDSDAEAGVRSRAGPADLRAALIGIVARTLERDDRFLAVLAHGYGAVWRALIDADPASAERLALALKLVDSPSSWIAPAESPLLAARVGGLARADGRLSAAVAAHPDAVDALEAAEPR
jgi:hypothetical protein